MSIPEADFDGFGVLRCFGRALARDDHKYSSEYQAAQLVERLIRQARVGIVEGARIDSRPEIVLFSRFVDLHRRHVRRNESEECDGGWSDGASFRGERAVAAAVRALPLEQREALLLVVLARFSHRDAAEVLGLSLNQFFDRLEKARGRLCACLAPEKDCRPELLDRSPHLRIVK